MAKTTKAERCRRNPDGTVKTRDIGTYRKCKACGQRLPESNFYFSNEGKYQSKCVPCFKLYSKQYRADVKSGKRKPVTQYAEEQENEKPDVISVEELKRKIKLADVFDIKKPSGSCEKARIEAIGKTNVVFHYINKQKYESFSFDDMIRIYTGKPVEG